MEVKKPKAAAPMPKTESDLTKNSMKLYTYLVCIAGLADYPDNTRMFRQKNLVLTQIYAATGITDKTVKVYMAFLEYNGKINYKILKGDKEKLRLDTTLFYLYDEASRAEDGKVVGEDEEGNKKIWTKAELRKAIEKYSAALWKERKKEKDNIYFIPRPDQWTPIPEITLERLNEFFEATEMELKLYYLCCGYRDLCHVRGEATKSITFEKIRDAFGLSKQNANDVKIRRSLLFLRSLGLIDYVETFSSNSKGAKIPKFKIKEVNYYINYEVQEENNTEDPDLREVLDRINQCFN